MNNSGSHFTEFAGEPESQQHFLGRALVKLQTRIQSVQIKVTSLTKIVRLLQQYSEKKDQQYEKQSHNMDLLDTKLSKMDNMQNQLVKTLQRCDQLSRHYRSHSIKIQQLTKKHPDSIQQMEDKVNYDLQEVNRKIKSLESTVLKNIRRCETGQEAGNFNHHSQNYLLDELTFRIGELESQFHNQYHSIKHKIDKMSQNNQSKGRKPFLLSEDSYGLGSDRKKSKGKVKQKQLSSIKRLKSK